VLLTILKGAVGEDTALMVRLPLPVFDTVIGCEGEVPDATIPKSSGFGLAVI
jgi:hypothetical protein